MFPKVSEHRIGRLDPKKNQQALDADIDVGMHV